MNKKLTGLHRVNAGRILKGIVLSSFLLFGQVPAATATQYSLAPFETPPVLQTSLMLPESVKQQGPLYKIDEQVLTDGFLMAFIIRSEYGTFVAKSPEMLAQRIREIGALDQLEKVSKSDAFIAGLKDSASELGRQVTDLVTSPVETVQGIPAGVGSFFSRVSRGAKTGFQKLGDIREQEKKTAPPVKGPGGELPGKPDPAAKKGSAITVEEAALRMTGQVTANAFGYDDQRRRIAKEVQVDPYSTNPKLTNKLDEIANAAFAGGLGVSVFKAVVPASIVITTTTTLSDWVWDTTPGELKVRNEASLKGMHVSQEMIDKLFKQPFFTLTLQTRLVNALQRLQDISGRPDIMPLAVTVESFDQARFVVETMEMLAQYHEKVSPLKSLEKKAPFAARTKAEKLVVAGPVDYLVWTKEIYRFACRPDLQAKERTLLLRGIATPLAQSELKKLDWKIQQNFSGNSQITQQHPAPTIPK